MLVSTNPLVLRLNSFHPLDPAATVALEELTRSHQRNVGARAEIVRPQAEAEGLTVVMEGWACRQALLDGRRQILGLCLPGDSCVTHPLQPHRPDYGVVTLTRVRLFQLSAVELQSLCDAHPTIWNALFQAALSNLSIEREWTVNLGRRTALERIAHLLCEVRARLQAVGWVRNDSCAFPLTQRDLGDAMGITAIHVNRVLQSLRASNIVEIDNRELTILDQERLSAVAMFDKKYLLGDRDEKGQTPAAPGARRSSLPRRFA